jgi:hypothetical protein
MAVVEFPPKVDLIAEMTGPISQGCSVIIDGHVIPHLKMFDHGDTIELMIDDRMIFPFPREWAHQAATFAATAMAVAAGFPHFKYPKPTTFATPINRMDAAP